VQHAVQQAVIASGLEYTFVQANAFWETFGAGLLNMGNGPFPESVDLLDSGDSPVYIHRSVADLPFCDDGVFYLFILGIIVLELLPISSLHYLQHIGCGQVHFARSPGTSHGK
jgi:hypothetical protein